MLASPTFRKIVLGSAIYDLIVTAPFATPWSFAFARTQLDGINQLLGGAALPAFEPFHVLFACLLGSVVLVVAVAHQRSAAALRPLRRHGAAAVFDLDDLDAGRHRRAAALAVYRAGDGFLRGAVAAGTLFARKSMKARTRAGCCCRLG